MDKDKKIVIEARAIVQSMLAKLAGDRPDWNGLRLLCSDLQRRLDQQRPQYTERASA